MAATSPAVPASAQEARAQRVLGLALPLTLVGAYGGWVTARVLASPYLHISSLRLPPAAATMGCAAGLGAGVVVHRAARRRIRTGERADEAFLLVKAVAPAGAVAGALSLWLARAAGPVSAVALGVAASLALLPLCLYIAKAAVLAGRARFGSLVAAADRRAMLGATAGALGAVSLLEVFEWFGTTSCWRPHAAQSWWSAHAAAVVAASTTAVALGVVLGHLWAWRKVVRWKRALDAMVPGDGALPDDDPNRLDLGLGAECHREERAHGSAYRHQARAVAVLRGDPEAASASLRRLTAHGLLVLAVTGGALASHVVASGSAPRDTGCGQITPVWSLPGPSEEWYP